MDTILIILLAIVLMFVTGISAAVATVHYVAKKGFNFISRRKPATRRK